MAHSLMRSLTTGAQNYRDALKVSIMLVALFWMLVFRLSESAPKVPDFVYVNF